MDVTASSSYPLTNVSYSVDGSNVRCSAAGSSLVVNSNDVYLTGKSIQVHIRSDLMKTLIIRVSLSESPMQPFVSLTIHKQLQKKTRKLTSTSMFVCVVDHAYATLK